MYVHVFWICVTGRPAFFFNYSAPRPLFVVGLKNNALQFVVNPATWRAD